MQGDIIKDGIVYHFRKLNQNTLSNTHFMTIPPVCLKQMRLNKDDYIKIHMEGNKLIAEKLEIK